jgi:hypothetical protein
MQPAPPVVRQPATAFGAEQLLTSFTASSVEAHVKFLDGDGTPIADAGPFVTSFIAGGCMALCAALPTRNSARATSATSL